MKLTHSVKNMSITSSTNIKASVDWSYFNKFNSITDGYLPATGEGETMASQLVTAMAKLIYKWYNDGDVYDNNYGLEGWCNDLSSYANWIYNHYPEATHILDRIRDCYLDSQYEDILKALADTLFDPVIIEESATRKCAGSIYTEDGPFSFTEFSEDEEDEEDEYDEYDDIYESTAITGNDLSEYYVDNKCQRYIHSLMPEIANLLEDEGYDVSFDENDTTLMISIFPQGEERSEGTYSFPKSALDCEGFNTYTDASNIVEILMNRAHFEDLYGCDSVTSATVLGWYDDDSDDESEWEFVRSKEVTDLDGFITEYTMYKNIYTGKYIFMFGDSDIYEPDEAYADHECDTEQEAFEWFNNYNSSKDERSIDDLIDDAGGYSRIKQLVQDTCEMYPGIEDDFEELAECLEGRRDLSYDNWLSVLEYLFEDDSILSTTSHSPEYAMWVYSEIDQQWELWGGRSSADVPSNFLDHNPDYSDVVVLPNNGSEPDDGRPVKTYSETSVYGFRTLDDKRNASEPYRYVTKHGIGPGTLPKDVNLIDWEDIDNYKTAIYLDRPLSAQELSDYDIYPETIQASSREYFGQAQSAQYGDLIAEQLSGKTISKRKDLGDQPGGLVYEAEQLGIDMWDLLEALEGMCYEGKAREIDDSTYKVLACDNAVISSASGQYVGEPGSSVKYGNFITESKWTSWTDVYTLFEDIIDKYLPDEDKIAEEVDKLYNTYKHNRYMRTAYDKWCQGNE